MSRATGALQGFRVMVTRPHGQEAELVQRLLGLGADVDHVATLAIEPLPKPSMSMDFLLPHYDIVIATSANVVRVGLPLLPMAQLSRGETIFLAVGASTSDSLQAVCNQPVVCPARHNSEGLLELPILQRPEIQDKSVLILKGLAGRDVLQETLRARGACVHCYEVYRRVPVCLSSQALQCLTKLAAKAEKKAVLCLTSVDSLQALLSNVPKHLRAELTNLVWLVPSSRVAVAVESELGLPVSICCSDSATDDALVNSLLKLAAIQA